MTTSKSVGKPAEGAVTPMYLTVKNDVTFYYIC